jgi:hypothetical protein
VLYHSIDNQLTLLVPSRWLDSRIGGAENILPNISNDTRQFLKQH